MASIGGARERKKKDYESLLTSKYTSPAFLDAEKCWFTGCFLLQIKRVNGFHMSECVLALVMLLLFMRSMDGITEGDRRVARKAVRVGRLENAPTTQRDKYVVIVKDFKISVVRALQERARKFLELVFGGDSGADKAHVF